MQFAATRHLRPYGGILEDEDRDPLVSHELSSDSSANQVGKLARAKSEVLFNLNDIEPITAAFRLQGKNVVTAVLIYTDIEFIRFYLSDLFDGCAEMVLDGVTRNSSGDINYAVVPESCE